MSDPIKSLLQDDAVRKLVAEAKTRAEAVKALLAAALKKGLSVTDAEIGKALDALDLAPNSELSDDQLLGVSGGMWPGGNFSAVSSACKTTQACDTKRINDPKC
jgi:hypothetical protein